MYFAGMREGEREGCGERENLSECEVYCVIARIARFVLG